MSIGPRQIPRIGEKYERSKRKVEKENGDILNYLPWLFIFKGWF